MTRRKAILFFGSLTVVIIGYVAWCSREMYLPVEMPYLAEIPEDVLPLVLQEIESTEFLEPEKFDFETFIYRLSDPLDPHPVQADVTFAKGQRIVGMRSDRGIVFWFEKKEGQWVKMDPKTF